MSKISAQEKIAELERRIADLETYVGIHIGYRPYGDEKISPPQSKEFWRHFDGIFESMEKMFKAIKW